MGKPFRIPTDKALVVLECMRKRPGALTAAGTAAGLDVRTVQRIWEYGYPNAPEDLAWMRRPLREVIAQEHEELRARMQEEKERTAALEAELEAQRRVAVRQKAIVDATESQKAELQMVRLARGNVIQTLAALANASAGAMKLGEQVKQCLEEMAGIDPQTGKARPITPGEAANVVRLLSGLSKSISQTVSAAAQAMDMERTLAGLPTSLVGHVHIGPMSVDEADRRISMASRMLERAKRNGLVVEGGSLEGGAMPALAPPPPPTGTTGSAT